jgi:hypothetical protein
VKDLQWHSRVNAIPVMSGATLAAR